MNLHIVSSSFITYPFYFLYFLFYPPPQEKVLNTMAVQGNFIAKHLGKESREPKNYTYWETKLFCKIR